MAIEESGEPATWLVNFISEVSSCILPLGFIGQLGFRYSEPLSIRNCLDRWIIWVYLVPHELSGGRHDGMAVVSGFRLNIQQLLTRFSEVTALEWKVTRGYTDGLAGPEVWLEGELLKDDVPVQFHFFSEPPSDELPDLVLDVHTNTLRAK